VVKQNRIEKIYEDYDALLSDPMVHAVYIPLPNHLHHPWTIKALKAGKHVLCEKPLACNAHEAQEMAEAANDTRLLMMEAFMYRYHPRNKRVKQMVAEGSIGTPYLVRSAFCYHIGEELLSSGECARLNEGMGGGALLDVGCYGASVTRWLLGSEPTQIQAQAIYQCGVDVHLVASLRFPDNALATIEASFISALQQTYTIVGDKGAIELPHDAFIPWERDAVFTFRKKNEETGEKHLTPGVDEYQLMIEHFSDAVSGKTPLDFPPEESIRNMRVMDALSRAARTGNTVFL
jgi:predicted dehydrogenase